MIFVDRQGDAANALLGALADTDYVARLENRLGDMFGANAVALCSVDAALHTALHLCGAERGDYIFVPSYTFYSYIVTVSNLDCVPVFVDCDPNTRCVSAAALETAFVWTNLTNKLPKAVIIDNAFGAAADYDVLVPLCKAWNVPIIELASGALGGTYKGVPFGANGDYGVVGFDKRLAGGGSALIVRDGREAAMRFTRGVYTDGENHDYGMHNAVAALDCAQLGVAGKIYARRRANLAAVCAHVDIALPATRGDAAEYALCKAAGRAAELKEAGYEVKLPPPVHTLPRYADCYFFEHEQGFSVCESLSDYCLIGMDISVIKRMRLIRRLKSFV